MTLQGGPVSSASKVMGAMMTASNTDVIDMLTASATSQHDPSSSVDIIGVAKCALIKDFFPKMAAGGKNFVVQSSKTAVTTIVAVATPCNMSWWWFSGLSYLLNPSVCPISVLATHYHWEIN